jgi:PAS domain-containing protein
MRESGQGADLAHAVRAPGASLGQERDRMRRVLSEIRETAAGGQKLAAEALVMIAAADSLATASYYRLQSTTDVSSPAPLAPGRPFVKARPDIHVAAPPNRIAVFEREVFGCFGVMPNFFCSASAAPGLIEELWAFAKSAYIFSPLPSLFKERLFVHLSRFCDVRYCIIRHVGFLLGQGRPAGDPKVKPETIEQVITLLQRPLPDANALARVFARLEGHEEAKNIPAPGTQAEYDLFDALTVMFLEPRKWERAGEAVRRAVGDDTSEILTVFLAFVRTAHYWTETHPKLAIEPDMLSVLEKHDRLRRLLVDPCEAERVKAPEALHRTLAELESSKASLRKSEQQLRWLASIVEFSDDAIVGKSLDGVIQSWNKGAERLFGYSAEEVIGKSITILIPPQRLDEGYNTRAYPRR